MHIRFLLDAPVLDRIEALAAPDRQRLDDALNKRHFALFLTLEVVVDALAVSPTRPVDRIARRAHWLLEVRARYLRPRHELTQPGARPLLPFLPEERARALDAVLTRLAAGQIASFPEEPPTPSGTPEAARLAYLPCVDVCVTDDAATHALFPRVAGEGQRILTFEQLMAELRGPGAG